MSIRQRKTESADLRKRYPIFVQVGLVASLVLLIVLFSFEFTSDQEFEIIEEEQEVVEVEEIQQTQQIERPPPPPKPPPPVEVADDVEVEDNFDLDIDMDFNEPADLPPPPPPPPDAEPEPEPEEPEIFMVVENPPELIGGLEELQKRVQYPELARRAGIEGTVFVQFVVDENGNVVDPVCLRDPGGGTCDAALAAVRDAKFEPGRQRGKAVKVRFSLPVRFRLR